MSDDTAVADKWAAWTRGSDAGKAASGDLEWAIQRLERGIVEIFNDGTPSQVGPDDEDLRRVILVLKEAAANERHLRRILARNRAYVSELHDAINANSMSRLVALKRGGLGRRRKAREKEWHVLK